MLSEQQIAEGWLPWDGSASEWGSTTGPLPPETWVAVKFRGKPDPTKGVLREYGFVCQMAWWHDGESDDIIAYMPVEEPKP